MNKTKLYKVIFNAEIRYLNGLFLLENNKEMPCRKNINSFIYVIAPCAKDAKTKAIEILCKHSAYNIRIEKIIDKELVLWYWNDDNTGEGGYLLSIDETKPQKTQNIECFCISEGCYSIEELHCDIKDESYLDGNHLYDMLQELVVYLNKKNNL